LVLVELYSNRIANKTAKQCSTCKTGSQLMEPSNMAING
jgi:hypothetical protein